MGIFFNKDKNKRKFLPLMYYENNEPLGRIVDEDDFSEDIAENIIMYCQRLNEMGVFSEKEIVRFDLNSIVEILVGWGVIEKISFNYFNVAQVTFGKEYAEMWYKNKESEPDYLYMIPAQLSFYNTNKKENYYISLLNEGLDLSKNEVSISDLKKNKKKIGKGTEADLTPENYKELRVAFSVLFMYLKGLIGIKAKNLGYYTTIESFVKKFYNGNNKDDFINYAKNFFSLNSERKNEYCLTRESYDFNNFFRHLCDEYNVGMNMEDGSFRCFLNILKEEYGINPGQKKFNDSFELFSYANKELNKIGKAVYFFRVDEEYRKNIVLIGKKNYIFDNKIDIDIVEFNEKLIEQYEYSIDFERHIRKIANEFYTLIFGDKADELLLDIKRNMIFNKEVYSEPEILYFLEEEVNIKNELDSFFSAHGMNGLLNELSIDGKTPDEIKFAMVEETSPYDRVTLYAEEIKKRGNILIYIDMYQDVYHFLIIKNKNDIKTKMNAVLEELREIAEIYRFEIFD